MNFVFYLAAAVAVLSTVLAISAVQAVHALLYFIVSLLAVALVFFVLGAPFAAALEVIIYAGAIAVLFVFVIMMLNLGEVATAQERQLLSPGVWRGPAVLAGILLLQLIYVLIAAPALLQTATAVPPKAVGIVLFGPYLLAVELASILLLAGLVATYHVGRRNQAQGE